MKMSSLTPGLHAGSQYFNADQVLDLLHQYQLTPLLLREILIDQAIAQVQISEVEEQAITQILQENATASLGLSAADQSRLRLRELRKARIETFKQQTWGNQIETYFLSRKTQLDRAVYYLLRHPNYNVCQELYFRLQESEETFAHLAPLYSSGTEVHTKGLVGPVEMSKLHPDLAQQLRNSQVGQLPSPIRLGDWWVIVELVEWIPAQLNDAIVQRLLNECFEQWVQAQLQQQAHPVSPHDFTTP